METSREVIKSENENSDEKLLDNLSKDLKNLEKEILPQIDGLAEKIPELYGRYAEMVNMLVDIADSLFVTNADTSRKLANFALIADKGIRAYGQYKAAVERNRLLDKYLQVKKTYASNNLEKVEFLIPKLKKSLKSSEKLFKNLSARIYNQDSLKGNTTDRVALLQLKALNMYRTATYLSVLTEYLKKEYQVWIKGNQTSGMTLPDYYQVNMMIAGEISKESPLKTYETAADSTNNLTGGQIMFLSDPQLAMLSLGEDLCKINPNLASAPVRQLIDLSGVVPIYEGLIDPMKKKVEDSPEGVPIIIGVIAFLGIIAMCIWLIPGNIGLRWLIGVIGCLSALRIMFKGSKAVQIAHVLETDEIITNTREQLDTFSGKIEQEKVDYEKKNPLLEAVHSLWD